MLDYLDNIMKKTICLGLVLCMLFSSFPVGVFASSIDETMYKNTLENIELLNEIKQIEEGEYSEEELTKYLEKIGFLDDEGNIDDTIITINETDYLLKDITDWVKSENTDQSLIVTIGHSVDVTIENLRLMIEIEDELNAIQSLTTKEHMDALASLMTQLENEDITVTNNIDVLLPTDKNDTPLDEIFVSCKSLTTDQDMILEFTLNKETDVTVSFSYYIYDTNYYSSGTITFNPGDIRKEITLTTSIKELSDYDPYDLPFYGDMMPSNFFWMNDNYVTVSLSRLENARFFENGLDKLTMKVDCFSYDDLSKVADFNLIDLDQSKYISTSNTLIFDTNPIDEDIVLSEGYGLTYGLETFNNTYEWTSPGDLLVHVDFNGTYSEDIIITKAIDDEDEVFLFEGESFPILDETMTNVTFTFTDSLDSGADTGASMIFAETKQLSFKVTETASINEFSTRIKDDKAYIELRFDRPVLIGSDDTRASITIENSSVENTVLYAKESPGSIGVIASFEIAIDENYLFYDTDIDELNIYSVIELTNISAVTGKNISLDDSETSSLYFPDLTLKEKIDAPVVSVEKNDMGENVVNISWQLMHTDESDDIWRDENIDAENKVSEDGLTARAIIKGDSGPESSTLDIYYETDTENKNYFTTSFIAPDNNTESLQYYSALLYIEDDSIDSFTKRATYVIAPIIKVDDDSDVTITYSPSWPLDNISYTNTTNLSVDYLVNDQLITWQEESDFSWTSSDTEIAVIDNIGHINITGSKTGDVIFTLKAINDPSDESDDYVFYTKTLTINEADYSFMYIYSNNKVIELTRDKDILVGVSSNIQNGFVDGTSFTYKIYSTTYNGSITNKDLLLETKVVHVNSGENVPVFELDKTQYNKTTIKGRYSYIVEISATSDKGNEFTDSAMIALYELPIEINLIKPVQNVIFDDVDTHLIDVSFENINFMDHPTYTITVFRNSEATPLIEDTIDIVSENSHQYNILINDVVNRRSDIYTIMIKAKNENDESYTYDSYTISVYNEEAFKIEVFAQEEISFGTSSNFTFTRDNILGRDENSNVNINILCDLTELTAEEMAELNRKYSGMSIGLDEDYIWAKIKDNVNWDIEDNNYVNINSVSNINANEELSGQVHKELVGQESFDVEVTHLLTGKKDSITINKNVELTRLETLFLFRDSRYNSDDINDYVITYTYESVGGIYTDQTVINDSSPYFAIQIDKKVLSMEIKKYVIGNAFYGDYVSETIKLDVSSMYEDYENEMIPEYQLNFYREKDLGFKVYDFSAATYLTQPLEVTRILKNELGDIVYEDSTASTITADDYNYLCNFNIPYIMINKLDLDDFDCEVKIVIGDTIINRILRKKSSNIVTIGEIDLSSIGTVKVNGSVIAKIKYNDEELQSRYYKYLDYYEWQSNDLVGDNATLWSEEAGTLTTTNDNILLDFHSIMFDEKQKVYIEAADDINLIVYQNNVEIYNGDISQEHNTNSFYGNINFNTSIKNSDIACSLRVYYGDSYSEIPIDFQFVLEYYKETTATIETYESAVVSVVEDTVDGILGDVGLPYSDEFLNSILSFAFGNVEEATDGGYGINDATILPTENPFCFQFYVSIALDKSSPTLKTKNATEKEQLINAKKRTVSTTVTTSHSTDFYTNGYMIGTFVYNTDRNKWEATIDEIISSTGAIFNYNVSYEKTVGFKIGGINVSPKIFVDVESKTTVEYTLNYDIDYGDNPFIHELRLNLYIYTFGGVGANIGKLASLKIGPFGTLEGEVDSLFSNDKNGIKLSLEGYIGAKLTAKFLCWTKEHEFFSEKLFGTSKYYGDYRYLENLIDSNKSIIASEQIGEYVINTYESSDLHLAAFNRFIEGTYSFEAIDGITVVDENVEQTLVPAITEDGDIFACISDDYSASYYFTNLGVTTVTAIDNSLYYDSNINVDGKNNFALFTWERLETNANLNDEASITENMSEIICESEIMAAIYTDSGMSAVTKLSDNSEMNLKPIAATNGSRGVVVWNNAYSTDMDNPLLADGKDTICYNLYDGNNWLGEQVLYTANDCTIGYKDVTMLVDGTIGITYMTIDQNQKSKVMFATIDSSGTIRNIVLDDKGDSTVEIDITSTKVDGIDNFLLARSIKDDDDIYIEVTAYNANNTVNQTVYGELEFDGLINGYESFHFTKGATTIDDLSLVIKEFTPTDVTDAEENGTHVSKDVFYGYKFIKKDDVYKPTGKVIVRELPERVLAGAFETYVNGNDVNIYLRIDDFRANETELCEIDGITFNAPVSVSSIGYTNASYINKVDVEVVTLGDGYYTFILTNAGIVKADSYIVRVNGETVGNGSISLYPGESIEIQNNEAFIETLDGISYSVTMTFSLESDSVSAVIKTPPNTSLGYVETTLAENQLREFSIPLTASLLDKDKHVVQLSLNYQNESNEKVTIKSIDISGDDVEKLNSEDVYYSVMLNKEELLAILGSENEFAEEGKLIYVESKIYDNEVIVEQSNENDDIASVKIYPDSYLKVSQFTKRYTLSDDDISDGRKLNIKIDNNSIQDEQSLYLLINLLDENGNIVASKNTKEALFAIDGEHSVYKSYIFDEAFKNVEVYVAKEASDSSELSNLSFGYQNINLEKGCYVYDIDYTDTAVDIMAIAQSDDAIIALTKDGIDIPFTDVELTIGVITFNITVTNNDLQSNYVINVNTGRNAYVVDFVENGGSEVTDATIIEEGTSVNKPIDPVKSGYDFKGWYIDIELTAKYDFSTLVTKDVTLYAKWQVAYEPSQTDLLAALIRNTKENDEGIKEVSFEATRYAENRSYLRLPYNFIGEGVLLTITVGEMSVTLDGRYFSKENGIFDICIEPNGDFYKVKIKLIIDKNFTNYKIFVKNKNRENIIVDSYYDGENIVFLIDQLGDVVISYIDSLFADIIGHWGQESIEAMAARGVTNGTSATTFSPNKTINRAEYVTMIARYFKLKTDSIESYSDVVVDQWYTSSIAAAKQAGILPVYYEEQFEPTKEISREEMMYILYQALCVSKKDGLLSDEGFILSSFKDIDTISDYAKDSINYLVSRDIIHGFNDLINPNDFATRAEVVELFYNLIKKICK